MPGAVRGRPKLYLFVALAVTAAITAAIYGVDYLLNPWAYAHAERPPLLGYWRGDIVVEPGDRRTVVLRLTHPALRSRSPSRINLLGGARVCGSRGAARYNLTGATENRDGTQFTIGFGGDDLGAGTHLDETNATCDGANRIELRTRLRWVEPDGSSRGTTSIDARSGAERRRIPFELRRSTKEEFDAACGRGAAAQD